MLHALGQGLPELYIAIQYGARRPLRGLGVGVCVSERAGRSEADAQLRDGRREAASDERQRGALNGDGGEALGPRVRRGVQAGILRAG